MTRQKFTVAGGGPVGSLLAILLARHGYDVGLYEGRPDSRVTNIYQGKSINIALSDRGWNQSRCEGRRHPDVSPCHSRSRRGTQYPAVRQ